MIQDLAGAQNRFPDNGLQIPRRHLAMLLDHSATYFYRAGRYFRVVVYVSGAGWRHSSHNGSARSRLHVKANEVRTTLRKDEAVRRAASSTAQATPHDLTKHTPPLC
eukprot:190043-Chlamydomonas_euryale.AAC.2